MEGETSNIPPWLVLALTNLATLLPVCALWYRDRKKLKGEIKLQSSQSRLADAQERFTEVQTEGAQIQNRKTLAEMLDGCYVRIDKLEATADELVRERNALKLEADKVSHLEGQIEIFEKQMSDLECVITFSGINKGEVLDKIKGFKQDG
jgi:regulator of replication initiation timing